MNFYIYKIINNINFNYYIGRRSCKVNVNEDIYFGSGQRLKLAIKKYGKSNFSKIILEICSSYEELVRREKEIITAELLSDDKCYNLAPGGHGGYTFYENRVVRHTSESKKKISDANKGRKRPDVAIRNINGFNKYWIGKKRDDYDRFKKSKAAHKRVREGNTKFVLTVQCPHCKKTGQQANMMRWHFDKCKYIS